MAEVELAYLADHPEHAETLAAWHHAQWGHLNPGRGVPERLAELRAQTERVAIPTTFVAVEDGALAGSASLLGEDMDTHPELGPWLGSVYVEASRRRRGIASRLVLRVLEEARRQGVARLYLFTPDQERLYARLGFRVRAREAYHGEEEVIMEIDLAGAP